MGATSLRALAAERIDRGELPCLSSKRARGGPAGGERCDLCAEPIASGDTMFAIARESRLAPAAVPLHFHIECLRAWREECDGRA